MKILQKLTIVSHFFLGVSTALAAGVTLWAAIISKESANISRESADIARESADIARDTSRIFHEANFAITHSRLEERDLAIASRIYEHPELGLIYVSDGTREGVGPYDRLSSYFLRRGHELTGEQARAVSARSLESAGLRTIEAINCAFWSDGPLSPVFPKYVRHYMYAESHVLLLYDVWLNFEWDQGAYHSDPRRPRVTENYLGYLNDVGQDVFFLMAVFDTIRNGYHGAEFYEWLRRELWERWDDKSFFEEFFPFLSDEADWERIIASENRNNDPCDELRDAHFGR